MVTTAVRESEPLISVCIANFNGRDVLHACIDSVLQQTGLLSLEILVHDDASTDGAVADLEERYPQVKLLVSERNVGFCVANNRMAAMATGRYLLLLNNDATLFPDALSNLLAEAIEIGRPAVLGLPQFDAASGDLVDRGCLLDPFFNPIPNRDPQRRDVAMVIGACLWIPAALWRELGGFPEWFGSIAEDMYICSRARIAGYPVRVLERSGYRHWQGRSFGGNKVERGRLSTTYRRRALSERNKSYVLVVVTPGAVWLPLLLLHLVLLHLEGLLLMFVRRDAHAWRHIYGPLLPEILRRRKPLMALRAEVQQQQRIAGRQWWSGFILFPHKLRMLLRHGMPDIR